MSVKAEVMTDYWPEYEGRTFARYDVRLTDESGRVVGWLNNKWTPLCDECHAPMFRPRRAGYDCYWECTADRFGHNRLMLWAEDWPDSYDEDED